ncbi:hypothetical protein ACFE04_000562 [Oxalis oulophora]
MAGMLPGVECARRRRFHRSGASLEYSPSLAVGAAAAAHGSTRKSSNFCLYTTNHDSQHEHHTTSLKRNMSSQGNEDENLQGVAKEAKERLDERLRTQKLSNYNRQENNNDGENSLRGQCELQTTDKRNGFTKARRMLRSVFRH